MANSIQSSIFLLIILLECEKVVFGTYPIQNDGRDEWNEEAKLVYLLINMTTTV